MHIGKRRSWELPDAQVTPESDYLRRRQFLQAVGVGLAATVLVPRAVRAATAGFPDALNPAFQLQGVKLTPYELITSYNNFYEWGLAKEDPKIFANKGWKTEPWTLEIGGLCDKPGKYDVNDLIKLLGGIEQRNYRHRCVEAWSMVIPWDGFALSRIIALSQPKTEAKYLQFTSFFDPAVCLAQRTNEFPWPYTEGLTLPEASNELAFLATGIYGKPLANQNGAPIRLVVPWKYGFKGAKSLSRIDFVADQPKTLWNEMAPNEYGFYANVNPEVDHPRWSQKSERIIGGGFFSGKQPTLMFNGYGSQVAALYAGMDLRKNF
ncbi:MAG TPA: protein-methionine-sulfoxide reductase catalytic subunit MsrP [Terrimicrobiaceae bacterium]|nr:protein-methionine-sulfoxide reductase catalytic subunit MsrP [Terrimicrobiaceae bacterium]